MNPTPPAPLVTDTASPTQHARARRKVRDRLHTAAALMRHQLSTYEGRQFLWRELEQHGVFEDIVGTDQAVYRAIGRRAEGLRLLQEAGVHSDLFNQMWVEGRQRAEAERKEAAAARLDEEKRSTET